MRTILIPRALGPALCLMVGKIYASGLWAHSTSRYVFDLGGKWKSLHGEAGLHTPMQPLTGREGRARGEG